MCMYIRILKFRIQKSRGEKSKAVEPQPAFPSPPPHGPPTTMSAPQSLVLSAASGTDQVCRPSARRAVCEKEVYKHGLPESCSPSKEPPPHKDCTNKAQGCSLLSLNTPGATGPSIMWGQNSNFSTEDHFTKPLPHPT